MPTSLVTQHIKLFKNLGFLFFVFTACFMFWFNDLLKPYSSFKNETNFVWDATGYYSYLPSTFYYGCSFEFDNGYPGFLPINEQGHHYPKYTYGVALLEAPFYGIGFLYAYFTNSSLNGFSWPFADAIRWGNFIYVMIGFYYLRKFLRHYFNEVVTSITLFCCLFGSLLYNYTFVQGEISHGYLFALFSLFLYFNLKWHQRPNHKTAIVLALTLGIISIVRFTDIYIALVFVLWNVKSFSDIKSKFSLLLNNFGQLLWFPLLGFLCWIPQMLFWKYHLGSYIFDPYIGEPFFWKDPQFLNILFSYRKGWVTYTPMVILAFIGMPFVKRDFPLSKLSFVFIIVLTTYIFSCWWDWVYGGCFGSRPFCPLIVLLALPIASISEFILYKSYHFYLKQATGVLLFVFIFSCTFLNMGQTYQYQEHRIIHGYHNSKFIYWKTFRRFNYDFDLLYNYQSKLDVRSDKEWRNGINRNDIKNHE